jgi:hypothetical protein
MSRQEAQTGSATSEYSTVPELAKTVRRNRKTVYGWIATGEIGEAAGPFVVQGRFLFHWSTFWAKQFKPREELSHAGSTLDSSAEVPLPDSGRRKCRQIKPTLTPPQQTRNCPERLDPYARRQENRGKLAEREGFEPSVPVTQYARLATRRRFANSVTSARLLKTVPTMARWLASATAFPPSLTESHWVREI